MAQSARYRTLVRRVDELGRNLLPTISPTGSYSDAQYDQTRAFRVLAHAEIEACIEDLAFDIADGAFNRWRADGRSRRSIIGLVAYHEGTLEIRPVLVTVGAAPEEIRDLVRRARNQFCNRVRAANNGIREKDVLAMLLPLGLPLADIDNAWLATADSFGRERGQTAHQSAAKATVLPDPASERATVGLIVAGLAVVDQKLAALRR